PHPDSRPFARRRDDVWRRRRARPVQLSRRLESRSLPHEAAARALHRRGREIVVGVRNLTTHVPVLTIEALNYLQPERGGLFVDCTVGLGGHARALLEAGATRVIGLDRDRDALAIARTTLAPWSDRVDLVHADYRALDEVLDERGISL